MSESESVEPPLVKFAETYCRALQAYLEAMEERNEAMNALVVEMRREDHREIVWHGFVNGRPHARLIELDGGDIVSRLVLVV